MNLGEEWPVRYAGARRLASLVALVLVNLIPLAGVLLFDWDVAALMILYWSENLVIGFYTLVKLVVKSPIGGWFSGLFFLIHYGGFCGVHGLFIVTMLLDEKFSAFPDDPWPLWLVFPQILFNVIGHVISLAPPEWLWSFAALFISHGVSFVANFLLADERDRLSKSQIMNAPYGRVIVLHLAVLFGGFAVLALGQPMFMLVILVLLKLGVDIAFHLREHGKTAERGGE
ncbi:DUF6498-containing protein [Haliea sp. E17]|uniref:DUF6498-containing protein n=1 Tax=Haliea sp. E17 TaxID=3401576 RepID=UPI003AAEA8AC